MADVGEWLNIRASYYMQVQVPGSILCLFGFFLKNTLIHLRHMEYADHVALLYLVNTSLFEEIALPFIHFQLQNQDKLIISLPYSHETSDCLV